MWEEKRGESFNPDFEILRTPITTLSLTLLSVIDNKVHFTSFEKPNYFLVLSHTLMFITDNNFALFWLTRIFFRTQRQINN